MGKIFGKKNKKLGLGLGGGGAKGSVHLGVLRAFEEEGIKFDVVVGTSIGSLIGALYARGLSAKEIETIISNSTLSDVKHLLFTRFTGGGVDQMIKLATGNLEFDDLKLPFASVAVDLYSGKEVVFTEGNLIKCIGASCAIPPYFHAVEYNDAKYVDGAFRNIIPCDAAKNLGADFVVGVDLSMNRQSNEISRRALNEMYPENGIVPCNPSENGYAACDVMIAPDLTGYRSTSITSMSEMFDIGYFAAKEKMPEVKAALERNKVRKFD